MLLACCFRVAPKVFLPRTLLRSGFLFCGVFMMQELVQVAQKSRVGGNRVGKLALRQQQRQYINVLLVPVVVGTFLLLWQGIVWIGAYPQFILPAPADVAASFGRVWLDGTLWRHAQITLAEIFSGLALGVATATVLGYALAKNQWLERLLAPYIVASQSVPVVAVAPLLIIWFGAGYLSKMLIVTLIVFFPMLVNTVVGIRSVDPNLQELLRSLNANRWQMFALLEVPAALPVLLGGLKVSVTLSVIGAVVGEFVGAEQGLGFLINQARGLFNTPLVFVAIFSLVAIALALYGLVSAIEAWALRWRA